MLRKLATFCACALLFIPVAVLGQQPRTANRQAPAAQRYGDHLELTVVGVRTAREWNPMPDMPIGMMPTITADPGSVLVIVQFAAKDLRSGRYDDDEFLSGFALEDTVGTRYASRVERTNRREIAVVVPDPRAIRQFRIAGLVFDIRALTRRLTGP